MLTNAALQSTGTDASQGKGQIISNINACVAVQGTVKSTLGPYGGDLLLVDANGRQTITNDGATVMKVRLVVDANTWLKGDGDSDFRLFDSFWILCTPPPAFSRISLGPKMPKSVTEQPPWLSWPVRF